MRNIHLNPPYRVSDGTVRTRYEHRREWLIIATIGRCALGLIEVLPHTSPRDPSLPPSLAAVNALLMFLLTSKVRRLVQFSKTSPYRGAAETGFIKISPQHLEGDTFVVWKTASRGGWMIPVVKLKAFIENIPTSKRSSGRTSWDPRIGLINGRDHLWTNMQTHGSLDVTEFRFSF